MEGAFRGTRGTGSPRGAGASDGPADLARVREIVAETGGSLWATTGPEDGIVATLRFPGAATRRDEPPATPLADAPRPLFILVVDDEVAIRCSIQRYLQRRGHRVDAAADGAEALALLEDLPPGTSYDVILSDLRMPGLGGRELLESIRQGRNSPAERVLFMTGDVTNNDAAWIVHATGAPALMKPIDLREVARIVERAADDPLPA